MKTHERNRRRVYDEWRNVHNETHGDTLLTAAFVVLESLFLILWCFFLAYTPALNFCIFDFVSRRRTQPKLFHILLLLTGGRRETEIFFSSV